MSFSTKIIIGIMLGLLAAHQFLFASYAQDFLLLSEKLTRDTIHENNYILQIIIAFLIIAIFSYSARIIYDQKFKKE